VRVCVCVCVFAFVLQRVAVCTAGLPSDLRLTSDLRENKPLPYRFRTQEFMMRKRRF